MIFQTLSILYMITTISAQTVSPNGPYADLFTYDEYVQIQSKRIRKEVRDLSADEWNAVVNAMHIMKNTPTAQGKTLYGDTYYSYDDLVCQHARGTYHTGGDFAHSGPQFNTWHRAFVLSFENILLSIDSSIQGAPYWDFRRDITEQGSTYDMTNSVIFSDQYFGEYSTVNDANGDYAVKTGKFAYWPISHVDDASELSFQCGDFFRNAFGYLRKSTNIEDTPYVTRFGGYSCGQPRPIGQISVWDQCLNNETLTDYTAFHACYDGGVHGSAHQGVGGTRLAFEGQTVTPGCRAFAGAAIFEEGVRQFAWHYGCYDCPTPGSCVSGVDDAYECGMCSYSDLVTLDRRGNYQCRPPGTTYTFRMNGVREELQIIGDFVDQVTSPNDPIFMFHHANVDRYLMEWQIRHYDEGPYYNYPLNGWKVGVNFNDVMTPEAPFTNLFNDPQGGPYTHKDIWDGTTILGGPYTYDSILELIYQTQPPSNPTTAMPSFNPSANPTTSPPITSQPSNNPITAAPSSNPTTAQPSTSEPSTNPTTARPSLNPSPNPTSSPLDLCNCYTTTLLSERRRGQNRCYRYRVNFCDGGVNSVVLGRGSSDGCGVNSYQDVFGSINDPNYVTIDTQHIGDPGVSGLRLDGLQSGDEFTICLDRDLVSGTQINGRIEYLTDSMNQICTQSDTVPNLCGAVGGNNAQIVEEQSIADDELVTHNQSKGVISEWSIMSYIWSVLCAVIVATIAH